MKYLFLKCATAALLCLNVLPAGAEVPDVLVRCQAIAEVQSRLACYDSAMEGLTASANLATLPAIVPTLAESKATPTPTEMFGREESASRDLVEEVIGSTQLDFIEAEVAVVQRTAYGELIIELDNGQQWRQIDSRSLRLKVGERVRISAASIGSFLLEKTSGSTSIRVRRLR